MKGYHRAHDTAPMPIDLNTRPALFPTPRLEPVADSASSPVVWIVMRTRDRPVLLRRAIGSVLSQTFEDWHLCIVNDGGAPASVDAIVEDHKPMLAGRVCVLHAAHSDGMEAASNRGLQEARARYFTIHDDDDTWHPEFLRRTVEFLDDQANAAFIGASTRAVVINERIEGDIVIEESRLDFPFRPTVTDLSLLLMENRYPPIALIFRTSLLDQIGGFNPALPVLGDWEFNIRAALAGDIASVDAPLAYYHHRHAPGQAAYGNTVTAGRHQHLAYETLLRNSMIRFGLRNRPELLGVLHPLLHAAQLTDQAIEAARAEQAATERAVQAMRADLQDLRAVRADVQDLRAMLADLRDNFIMFRAEQEEVRRVASWHARLLRPGLMLWRGILPLRRMIARARGRI